MNCERPLRPRPGGPLGRLAPSSLVASGAARRATYGSTHFACGHTPDAGRTARRRVPARTPASVTGPGFVGTLSYGLNPGAHGAPYVPANSPPRPAHARHREPRERRVAAGARRVLAFHLSVHPNPRPQQSACRRGRVLLAVAAVI